MDEAIEEWDIRYLSADDTSMETWQTYEFFTHPSFALINPDGSLERKAAGMATVEDNEEWVLSQIED